MSGISICVLISFASICYWRPDSAGWLSLGLIFYFCGLVWGWAMGPVGWLGLMSLSGFVLLMLLPYRPRLAVWLALYFAPAWAVIETVV